MSADKNIKSIQGLLYYTGSHVKIKELNKLNSRPTEFGHKVWDTSLVFIDFLADNNFDPQIVTGSDNSLSTKDISKFNLNNKFVTENISKFNLNNKSVLEIGCGWGLLGLYFAKNLNCNVTCTDLDEKVLPIVHAHAELNKVSVKTKALSFNQISAKDLKVKDILVGVEVCYSEEAAIELNELIKRAYQSGVQQIFIADPGRPDFLDIVCNNDSGYKKEIYKLPGTKNGKITNLLHLMK